MGLLGMSLIISSILILLIKVYKDYLKEMKEKIIFQIGLFSSNFICYNSIFSFQKCLVVFSTFNSSYTFLILGFLIGLNELRYNKENSG